MVPFTAIDDAFRFDATSDFLKKLWNFGLLFAQMRFGLITKISKAEAYLKPCKTSK